MSTQSITLSKKHTINKSKPSIFSEAFWEQQEFNRYGIMVVLMLVQSCIGSIAAMYALKVDGSAAGILLSLTAMFAMTANSLAIAQASMKTIWLSSIASVLVSIVVTLIAFGMNAA